MCDPVLSRVFSQREVLDALFAYAIAKMEKTPETGLREDGVRRSGIDLISREVSE